MPTGIPKYKFIKYCKKCGDKFETLSNRAKYCKKCIQLKKEVICEICGNKFLRNKERIRKNYCPSCINIKFYCKCGCGSILDFDKGVNGIEYAKGHGRKGKSNSIEHNLKIGEKNKGRKLGSAWNSGLTKELDSRLICPEERKNKIKIIAKEKGFGKWMKGRKPSKQIREKISRANKGHLCTEETKRKISRANMGENNGMYGKHHTKKIKEQISKTISRLIIEGMEKKTKYKTGYFYSNKNNKKLWFRSSYEESLLNILENSNSVKRYLVEPFFIPYIKNGILCNYIPDLLIEYKNGNKALIEVKPAGLVKDQTNSLKFLAAEKYCRQHNLLFSIWTEKELTYYTKLKAMESSE